MEKLEELQAEAKTDLAIIKLENLDQELYYRTAVPYVGRSTVEHDNTS